MAGEDVSVLLREAAPAPQEPTDVEALWARGRRLHTRRRLTLAAGALVAVAVLAGGAVALLEGLRPQVRLLAPTVEAVETAGPLPAAPALRTGDGEPLRVDRVELLRIGEGGTDADAWTVYAQRATALDGIALLVEAQRGGTAATLPMPEDGLAAVVRERGDVHWVLAVLVPQAASTRVQLSDGQTVEVAPIHTAWGASLAVARVEADAAGAVAAVEAVDADGQVLASREGDELAYQAPDPPTDAAGYEPVADGELDGVRWELGIAPPDEGRLPPGWVAVHLRALLEDRRGTNTMLWQLGGAPDAPFRPHLIHTEQLVVSGWVPDGAERVRVHHADGQTSALDVHRPEGNPFAFYVAPVPLTDRDHPTRGIDAVEALDGAGATLERWQLDDVWADAHQHGAHQLIHAVLRGDDAHIAVLTAPDWTQTAILRDLAEDLGGDVAITTWPLNTDAPPGELRSVCLTLTGLEGEHTGGLMYRHVEDAWKIWEFRPNMLGCQ